ncbi:NAD(P)-binding protein [Mollisia scopiformis]|uniref:NAD(P)-binding protein n=1 Tax=Mollisia scopiformis TaxID=149040 RepID=A0A194XMI8_MOLSC|nr:NAD(P)-binding protein [Mollisia scopiformis]KUJ21470.1 NAD(P)-binding protein [Mollisia scopiformis]
MSKPEFTLRTDVYPAIEPELFKGSLNGKVAFVTGSGRGIGREIVLALARSGAAVAISGRTKSQVEETTQAVLSSASGVKAIGVVGDVCSRTDQERMVKEVTESLGPIDILICNAGTNTFMPFHMTDPDEWWKQMEIMVKSPTELTRMILPMMQKRNSGTIIYTSSRAAGADLPWAAGYSCAKTAITRFAGILQNELNILQKDTFGHDTNGISVFSIHPGEVKTKLHETAFPQKTKDEAPYVIEHMAKMAKMHPDFKAELAAWTCVYLSAGNGAGLEGRLVDCTRDIEEVKKHVTATPRPRITNACG